jgi:TATA-binding protein-associated factor Taf7
MHRRRIVETNDRHDEERKKHHYKRAIDICKMLVDTIVFEHEFAKWHLQLIFNENRVHRKKKKARNAKTYMRHDFDWFVINTIV